MTARMDSIEVEIDEHIRQHLSPASLQRIELFRDLSMEDLEHLASRLHFLRAPKATVVCTEGDPSDAMYILETGQVKVVSDVETQRLTLATLGPGAQFGRNVVADRRAAQRRGGRQHRRRVVGAF